MHFYFFLGGGVHTEQLRGITNLSEPFAKLPFCCEWNDYFRLDPPIAIDVKDVQKKLRNIILQEETADLSAFFYLRYSIHFLLCNTQCVYIFLSNYMIRITSVFKLRSISYLNLVGYMNENVKYFMFTSSSQYTYVRLSKVGVVRTGRWLIRFNKRFL